MAKINNKIKLYERLARIEENLTHIDKIVAILEKKIDVINTQVASWKGTFSIISVLGGMIAGGVISLIVWLIVH